MPNAAPEFPADLYDFLTIEEAEGSAPPNSIFYHPLDLGEINCLIGNLNTMTPHINEARPRIRKAIKRQHKTSVGFYSPQIPTMCDRPFFFLKEEQVPIELLGQEAAMAHALHLLSRPLLHELKKSGSTKLYIPQIKLERPFPKPNEPDHLRLIVENSNFAHYEVVLGFQSQEIIRPTSEDRPLRSGNLFTAGVQTNTFDLLFNQAVSVSVQPKTNTENPRLICSLYYGAGPREGTGGASPFAFYAVKLFTDHLLP